MTTLIPLTNTPRDYAWGAVNGVARALGHEGSGGPEAELWLGAHPLSPSRLAGSAPWADLEEWERVAGTPLPYLLKVLAAASPLSLQAHPTTVQARAGFAREEAAGVLLDAPERNYKDSYAKPELIVALEDGFEALCGFRPVAETISVIDALAVVVISGSEAIADWRVHVEAGIQGAFAWLLSGAPEVEALVQAVTAAADGGRFELIQRLAAQYPGDPGIAIALMLNHVTLAAGEALWLPAGNIHAYLRGTGIELMGPSDNVLRGGLTPKHVDRAELQAVLDFTPGSASWLAPVQVSANVVSYRPASLRSGAGVDFELLRVTGDATVTTGSPAIAVVVDGAFDLSSAGDCRRLERGDIVFMTRNGNVDASGFGRMFVATGTME